MQKAINSDIKKTVQFDSYIKRSKQVGIIRYWKPWDSVSCQAVKYNLFLLEKTIQLKSYIKSSKQVGLVAGLMPMT